MRGGSNWEEDPIGWKGDRLKRKIHLKKDPIWEKSARKGLVTAFQVLLPSRSVAFQI
jgi:hypothetical protein